MATTTTEQTLTEYRVAMIEELDFTHEEAEKLSNTMYDKTLSNNGVEQTYHIRTDHHFVRRMLKGGATRQQVLDILT